MIQEDIFSNPILISVYTELIKGYQDSSEPKKIIRQAKILIKKILLHKILIHIKASQWLMLCLDSYKTEQLRQYLIRKAAILGQTKSDAEITQEIETLNLYFDAIIQTVISTEVKK